MLPKTHLPFCYNAYWRTWSRVLGYDPAKREFIELNLSHINGKWERAKAETIRVHTTPRAKADIPALVVPLVVRQAMDYALGKPLAQRLFEYDYLTNLDFQKLDLLDKGSGVPFSQVMKGK